MGRGLGTIQREVLQWLNLEFEAGRFPNWYRVLDQFVVSAGHRGEPLYPYPHLEGCCCRVCWVQQYGLEDTKDNWRRFYKPENWGQGHWISFFPDDEKRYQDHLSTLSLPENDPVAKRESYRRAIRSLIDRKLIALSIHNGIVPFDHPDACQERPGRGDIRPRWRQAICALLTDEWQHPIEMCKAIWDAEWADEASEKTRLHIERQGIKDTIFYHYYFRSQLNVLRKNRQIEILRTTSLPAYSSRYSTQASDSWICDGKRMEGARIIGIRFKR
jgi:hypothetical protein